MESPKAWHTSLAAVKGVAGLQVGPHQIAQVLERNAY